MTANYVCVRVCLCVCVREREREIKDDDLDSDLWPECEDECPTPNLNTFSDFYQIWYEFTPLV
jgi:hypothetical protein